MRKLLAIAAVLALTFALGMGTALAVVSWPSTATTWAGVNQHLNALHTTDASQFSRAKVISATLTPSGGDTLEGSVQCPGWSQTTVGWSATGGGVLYPDTSEGDGDYYVSMSGPWTQMGTDQSNGWKAVVSNPTYNGTDPLPTDIKVYVVCVT